MFDLLVKTLVAHLFSVPHDLLVWKGGFMYEVTFGWGSSKEVMLIDDTRSLVQLADDLKTKGYIITTPGERINETPDTARKMAVMFTQVSHIRVTDE